MRKTAPPLCSGGAKALSIVQIVIVVMVAGGGDLTVTNPALHLHFLHLLVDQLLDKERVLHVFQHQRGTGARRDEAPR